MGKHTYYCQQCQGTPSCSENLSKKALVSGEKKPSFQFLLSTEYNAFLFSVIPNF